MEDNKELLNENENLETEEKSSDLNVKLDVVFIDHENYDADKYVDRIEEKRADFYRYYKKSRRISNIATIVVLAIAVGAVILITSGPMVCKIIGWVLAGIGVVGLIIFYALNHNKLPNKANDYIKDVSYLINQRMFDDSKLSQLEESPKEKMEIADIISDNVYTNVVKMPSRNIIRGRYENHGFKIVDLACYRDNKSNKSPLFVGKYITMQNDLHFEGRFVLVLKRKENPLDLPNSVQDLAVLFEDETHVFYGPEGAKYNELLGREFISRINHFKVEDALLNVNIVVWAGHTAAYLSYGDDVMSIPFDKSYNYQANEQFRSNLTEMLSDMTRLLK